MGITNLNSNNVSAKNGKAFVSHPYLANKPGMLLIWWNSCGHCHQFIPVYKELCNTLGDEFPCAAIENAQFSDNEKVSKALDFVHFPTIKFFAQNGEIIGTFPDKEMERTKENILQYICKFYHHCIMYH